MMNQKQVDKFNKLADSLTSQIERKRNTFSNSSLTPRRARLIQSANYDADRLQQLQLALRVLANLYTSVDVGTPVALFNIKTKKQVEKLLCTEYRDIELLYPKYYEDLVPLGLDTYNKFKVVKNYLLDLVNNSDTTIKLTEDEKKIKSFELQLVGVNIPDFFPTPVEVIEKMIEKSNIKDGMKVLEPSAGKGDIADYIKKHYNVDLIVIEKQYRLCELLELKNHKVISNNFFDVAKGEYDLIIQNPPFTNYQDVDHVYHAYENLKVGGVLVSIMAASAFQNSHKKATEFRDWLNTLTCEYEKLPDNSFKKSFNSTGVNCYMLTIWK